MNKLKELLGNWMVSLKTFPIAHLVFFYLTVVGILEINHGFLLDVFFPQLLLSGGIALIWSLYGPMLNLHLKTNDRKIRLRNF